MTEQTRYQVRFDFGYEGARAVGADADVIVWVDALGNAPVDLSLLPSNSAVIVTGLANAKAAADWVITRQGSQGPAGHAMALSARHHTPRARLAQGRHIGCATPAGI